MTVVTPPQGRPHLRLNLDEYPRKSRVELDSRLLFLFFSLFFSFFLFLLLMVFDGGETRFSRCENGLRWKKKQFTRTPNDIASPRSLFFSSFSIWRVLRDPPVFSRYIILSPARDEEKKKTHLIEEKTPLLFSRWENGRRVLVPFFVVDVRRALGWELYT